MKARARIFASGRVQGVFYRENTRRWASSKGLKGWVKNLLDGRVEALVEGDKESIQTLIGQMREGPPMARVETIEVEWEEYKGEFPDFFVTW
jgi:acylphosphatase